ncbi:MAG TPA: tetratricopeptide repeat protein, partial [bacterium]|nr:tetratricopeptide repeat protein [bacterium]
MKRTLPWACLALALASALGLGACAPSVPSQAQIQAASPAGLQSMESQLRQAQKDHPKDARVLLQLARVLLRRGALAEAEQLALQADQQAPAQAEILEVLAQIYLAQDKRFRALTTASQAVLFEPDLLSAYITVARANALLG